MKVYALLLCGGSGTRMGGSGNKTLLEIGGVPGIVRCCRAYEGLADGIVLVTRAREEALFARVLAEWGVTAPVKIVPGGEDRQASALRGLQALPDRDGMALIHDGARPLVTGDVIRRVIDSVRTCGSGAAAVPARDTIKRADAHGRVVETPDRASLWQMQTPQGFFVRDLLRAHESAGDRRYTDDAALMEAAGFPVQLVMGDYRNVKMTSPEDWKMAQGMMVPRIGTGFDAHRLVENRALWLGGVCIPYEKGLDGHSDADAAVHALIDALLGAAGMGDIGALFPDSDDAYKGISSVILLKETARRIREKGYEIGNADVTILAQRPKMAPYIPAMRQALAEALGIPQARVSVKATTTERMGYEGRGEGISAQAAALIYETV